MKKNYYSLYSVIIPIVIYVIMRYFLIYYEPTGALSDNLHKVANTRKIVSFLVGGIGIISIFLGFKGINLYKHNKKLKGLWSGIIGIVLSIVISFMTFGSLLIANMN